jgi:phosphoribosylformylglycinamidine synthase PurS subunit
MTVARSATATLNGSFGVTRANFSDSFTIMIRAQVIVRPRKSIFDPQGDAVCRAIQHLGVSAVKHAHVGKCIELELEGEDIEQARTQLETICKDLLSNPVIEDYVLTLQPAD